MAATRWPSLSFHAGSGGWKSVWFRFVFHEKGES